MESGNSAERKKIKKQCDGAEETNKTIKKRKYSWSDQQKIEKTIEIGVRLEWKEREW